MRKSVLLPLVLFAAACLSGCSVSPDQAIQTATPGVQTILQHGRVLGGQQPVSGASIQLMAVSYMGTGSASFQLLSPPVLTDSNGNFSISSSTYCPPTYSSMLPTYIAATGGNPGLSSGQVNPSLALVAYLGPCNQLGSGTFVDINERTTVAALTSLAPYASNYYSIGAGSADVANALRNDVLQAQRLVDTRTGTIPGPLAAPGYSIPQAKLNTLADILATCVNSAGGVAGDGSVCGTLFKLTTPTGGSAPTNTADAVISLAQHAELATPSLFNLLSNVVPFEPTLTSSPTDWSMAPTPIQPVAATYPICTMWGDSLTDGSEDWSSVTVPTVLAKLDMCATTSNQGIGGQTSTQIGVREGGIPTTVTVVGGVIPAAEPVAVQFPAGYEYVTRSGYDATVSIAGVEGTIANGQFTRITSGSAVSAPANLPLVVNNHALNSGFVIIWAGRNNASQQAQVLSDIKAMVDHLPSPKHFLVLSVINGRFLPVEAIGGITYQAILSLNGALQAAYPNNYMDARSFVVSLYDPTNPVDVAEHALDVPSYTTRSIDLFDVLQTAIPDTTSCNFEMTNGAAGANTILRIENEYIQLSTDSTQAADGNWFNQSCSRGAFGSSPTPHVTGVNVYGMDPLHLNGPKADAALAAQINEWIRVNDPPQ